MRVLSALVLMCAASGAGPAVISAQVRTSQDVTAVRRELEQWYEKNKRGFLDKNVAAIMTLRTADFHTVGPDSVPKNRADMEQYTVGFLNGIDRWISMSFDLDSIKVFGDTASAVVHQHLVRMAQRPDGLVHHVETWATQREAWKRTADGWKLYRVDNVRDQKRLVDGKPG